MTNFIMSGKVIPLAAPYDVLGGAGLLVGFIFGVASGDALSGAIVEVQTEGVFAIKKDATQAVSAGAKVYWDNAAKQLTTTAGGNSLVGAATVAALAADTTVETRLNGVTV